MITLFASVSSVNFSAYTSRPPAESTIPPCIDVKQYTNRQIWSSGSFVSLANWSIVHPTSEKGRKYKENEDVDVVTIVPTEMLL